MKCEVCGAPATHVCSGLDEPAVYFCETHGQEHAAEQVCEGQLVRMGSDAVTTDATRR